MTTLLLTQSFGTERIEREAFLMLSANFNTKLASVTSAWSAIDAVSLENVAYDHFYQGHHPSLIEAPPTDYPNVSVIGGDAIPDDDQLDHFNTYQVELAIEIMVKATEAEGATICNKRMKRAADAANAVIMDDRSLNGIVNDIPTPPSLITTDCFKRRETKGHGPYYFWQGARIEYLVQKTASFT